MDSHFEAPSTTKGVACTSAVSSCCPMAISCSHNRRRTNTKSFAAAFRQLPVRQLLGTVARGEAVLTSSTPPTMWSYLTMETTQLQTRATSAFCGAQQTAAEIVKSHSTTKTPAGLRRLRMGTLWSSHGVKPNGARSQHRVRQGLVRRSVTYLRQLGAPLRLPSARKESLGGRAHTLQRRRFSAVSAALVRTI